jgi:exonuclease III
MNTALTELDSHLTKNTAKSPAFTLAERQSLSSFLSKGWIDSFRHLHPKKQEFTWWHIKFLGR